MKISRNENMYLSMLRSIEDTLVASDANHRIIYVNPAAEHLFGKSAVDLLGSDIKYLGSFIHEKTGKPVTDLFKQVFESNGWLHLPDDCILVNFLHHRIPVSGTVSTILNKRNQPDGLVIILQDISGRREVERDLMHARDAAEEMNRVKRTLLANMSHEMRTPLTGILGFASILELDLPEGETREMANRIHLSGRRLLETIESILDLAKLESEKVEVNLEKVNIIEEIDGALEFHSQSAQQNGLNLRVNTDLQTLIAEIDRQLFSRIMYNLISNAMKYTTDGEISVHINRLQINERSFVQIDVQDTGVGISPEFLPKVFDEFQQESFGISRKFEGSGLGLTISRKLVELMGGSISVSSKKNQGSIFSVLLPLYKAERHTIKDTKTDVIESDATQKPKILLVEDDYDSSVITRFYLGKDSDVKFVDSGEKALDMLEKSTFDLVIMDISLGSGMDGVSAMKTMRSNPLLKDLPIVALTAHALSGDADFYLKEGFTGYLSKPFKKEELLRLVGKLLLKS